MAVMPSASSGEVRKKCTSMCGTSYTPCGSCPPGFQYTATWLYGGTAIPDGSESRYNQPMSSDGGSAGSPSRAEAEKLTPSVVGLPWLSVATTVRIVPRPNATGAPYWRGSEDAGTFASATGVVAARAASPEAA